MAGKKINAFNELCKDTMIANMVDAMNVFRGAYKKIGIPARTGLTSVVTRLSTEEQRSRTDASVSWLAIKFEAMGVFNPEDYTTK